MPSAVALDIYGPCSLEAILRLNRYARHQLVLQMGSSILTWEVLLSYFPPKDLGQGACLRL